MSTVVSTNQIMMRTLTSTIGFLLLFEENKQTKSHEELQFHTTKLLSPETAFLRLQVDLIVLQLLTNSSIFNCKDKGQRRHC